MYWRGFPGGSVVKNPPAKARHVGSIFDSGRSPGKGNGNLLQCFCLGNPMDRGAWKNHSLWGRRRLGYNLVTKQQQFALLRKFCVIELYLQYIWCNII